MVGIGGGLGARGAIRGAGCHLRGARRLFLSLVHTNTLSLTQALSLSHTHTLSHTHKHTLSHTHQPHSLTYQAHSLTQTHSLF